MAPCSNNLGSAPKPTARDPLACSSTLAGTGNVYSVTPCHRTDAIAALPNSRRHSGVLGLRVICGAPLVECTVGPFPRSTTRWHGWTFHGSQRFFIPASPRGRWVPCGVGRQHPWNRRVSASPSSCQPIRGLADCPHRWPGAVGGSVGPHTRRCGNLAPATAVPGCPVRALNDAERCQRRPAVV